jgi:AmmeMemoRadiSam system protein A
MSDVSESEKILLLRLAREAIRSEIENREMDIGEIPDTLKERMGVFVTLTKRGELRGCIGMLEPVNEIADAVVRNSRMAAFSDARFDPLREEDLDDIVIEVSLLSPVSDFVVDDPGDLIRALEEEKPGLVISSGAHRATFLPHVWGELKEARVFLSNLCMKAGLPPNFWKDHFDEMEFQTYTVESFKEGEV